MNWLSKFLTGIHKRTVWTLVFFTGAASAQGLLEKPDVERGRVIATQVCAACHGVDGNIASEVYPKLAGQHADYLYKQLVDYKVAAGASKSARSNLIMAGFAAALSEQDAKNVSAYFASQKSTPGFAHDREKVALGQKIWRGGIADKGVPACAACHGPTGAGIPTQYPHLAGQAQAYTIAQMQAFQEGSRSNSIQMQTIAARLSAAEIQAVADYIAGLR